MTSRRRSATEFADLFRRMGARDAEDLARGEIEEDLGNLVRAGFAAQAWKQVPGSGDVALFERWLAASRKHDGDAAAVAACDRLLAAGARPEDLLAVVRAFMAEFLFGVAYLMDDPSFEDEALAREVHWGFYEEDADMRPLRRIGGLHELVPALDPESAR